MHTGIVFAVEADDAEEAIAMINTAIDEERFAEWSDWSEPSGRWSDVVEGGVLRYSDNPEKFNQIVDKFRESTEQVLIDFVKDYGHLTLDELVGDPRYSFGFDRDEFTEETHRDRAEKGLVEERTEEERRQVIKDSLASYKSIRALEIVQGRFTSDSHFYDYSGSSLSRKWLNERIAKDPEKQFVVVWDFHY